MKRLAVGALALSTLDPVAAIKAKLQSAPAGPRSADTRQRQRFTACAKIARSVSPDTPDSISAGSVAFCAGACTALHVHPLSHNRRRSVGSKHTDFLMETLIKSRAPCAAGSGLAAGCSRLPPRTRATALRDRSP